MSPHVLCVCSQQRGGLHGLLNLAISPERMPLMHGCHRPPPDMPDPGIDPTTSPVALAGDPCVGWGGGEHHIKDGEWQSLYVFVFVCVTPKANGSHLTAFAKNTSLQLCSHAGTQRVNWLLAGAFNNGTVLSGNWPLKH